MTQLPFSLYAYRVATAALSPIAPSLLKRRARRGKENLDRLSERLGHASLPRPEGTLVWIHGASVGESLSVLPLIGALLSVPGRSVLMTTGTVTSAEMLAGRLPPHAFHQFASVDTPAAVDRFLDHWRPAIGLFVDSEIWPNTLLAAHRRGIGLALVNGRMSEKSFAGWRKVRRMAATLLSLYDICLVQDDATAQRLAALGARAVTVTGSLKADAPPLAADPAKLSELERLIQGRPIFLAASTHPGEEEFVLHAHDRLRAGLPSLLTVIVPRHPPRGADIAALCAARRHAQRSLGTLPDAGCEIYIADTMGELGLFYRLAPFAFVGGSLVPHGGQNPLEPACLGAAVLAGPYTDNFQEAYTALFARQGFGRVGSPDGLAALAEQLLVDPAAAREGGKIAADAVRAMSGALDRARTAIEDLLAAHART